MPTRFQATPEIYIKQVESFQAFIKHGTYLENCTIQDIDFSDFNINWSVFEIKNTTFLGCKMSLENEFVLRKKGARVYPPPTENLPYNPFRKSLYSCTELMKGFDPKDDQSTDIKIYRHFSKGKFNPNINESLWQRIHDHAIDDALRNLLEIDDHGMSKKKCVGIMGGHSTLRSDPYYTKAALTTRLLSKAGYYVVSGGGPGIMEASNLGAYFGNRSEKDLLDAIELLLKSPHFLDEGFHEQAFKVIKKYPNGSESLAIPTWFYGHEPSNLFATQIAKYFSNSIREDTLLGISLYGLVCAPGSAGTTQEIFQDAAQNHYGTFNYYSPMVFLGRKRYEVDTLIYPLLRQLAYGRAYYDLLHITDEPQDVLAFLEKHPPIKK